jgi:hypothetical protein
MERSDSHQGERTRARFAATSAAQVANTTLHIILPMLVAMKVDLIWFGPLIALPVGMNLFVCRRYADGSMARHARSMNERVSGRDAVHRSDDYRAESEHLLSRHGVGPG